MDTSVHSIKVEADRLWLSLGVDEVAALEEEVKSLLAVPEESAEMFQKKQAATTKLEGAF